MTSVEMNPDTSPFAKDQKRRIFMNAAMSVLQTLVLGITPFVLYKFLLKSIGIEQVGIWSVVLSSTSITRIGELGLSASVVKFVAKYKARNETENLVSVIQTAVISTGVLISIILFLAYPLSSWLLSLVIPIEQLDISLTILPYALVSLFFSVITSVLQSGLDGCQRIDLRSRILIGTALFDLLLCFMLTPYYGLVGLAYARVTQAIVSLLATWMLLRRNLPALPLIPHKWHRRLFREMLVYGLNFQAISFATMLYEPTTTALLSRFGGLTIAGYFEMAKRMVRQIRSLIISANQTLIPLIADLQERNPEAISTMYKESYGLLFFIALPLYTSLIAITPIFSEIWIGYYQETFVRFSFLLVIGWCLNSLNAPSYFANLGTGDLFWNTISHVAIAAMNGVLGLLLGSIYGGFGVVLAWVLSLAIGSLIIPIAYHKKHNLTLAELVPKESRLVLLTGILGASIAIASYYCFRDSMELWGATVLVVTTFTLIVIIPIWIHPMRKRTIKWVVTVCRDL